MGRLLAVNGALFILGGLILLTLAAALTSLCFGCLTRCIRHFLIRTSSITFTRKVSTNGST